MLKRFIAFNKKCCKLFENSVPTLFQKDDPADDLTNIINHMINKNFEKKLKILEAGGIDRPLLGKSSEYIYDGIDIEYRKECNQVYDHFLVQSVENPINGKYDIIMSKTLMEHVKNNHAAIRNFYASLNIKGLSCHYIPCKNHPYSISLRLVGPNIQKKLIPWLRPSSVGHTGYPAFFHLCSEKELKNEFTRNGFQQIKIKRYFKGYDYFYFFFPAFFCVVILNYICRKLEFGFFSSGVLISGIKQ